MGSGKMAGGFDGWAGASLVGGPGDGAQGAQGFQGFQGVAGGAGVQGAQGVGGAQGSQGAGGAQGAQGLQGTVGAQGAQGSPAVVQSVATFAALSSLASAGFTEGQPAYVQSAKASFNLELSSAATRTNYRIAASGLAGYQWVRQPARQGYWEVQAAWFVDPTNSTGLANDDNSGVTAILPLLTYQELAWRLAAAEINQSTTVMCGPGNQQAGDLPTWTYVCRNQNMNFVGVPTVIYSSTVTSFAAAAVGTSAADDNELGDTAVPGGSFTAAGALTAGRIIKRTNGTVIYAAALKDLGGTTLRVGQPANTANLSSTVAFANGDTYQLLSLPQLINFVLPPNRDLDTAFTLIDWEIPAATANGVMSVLWTTCYIGKLIRLLGSNNSFGACTFNLSGGGSFELGGPNQVTLQMVSFIGTGATRYSFAGAVNSEGCVTCLQGCQIFLERGIWNGGQINMYDSSVAAIQCGTGARWHTTATGNISGKNNTGKLALASDGSQILTNLSVSTGGFFTAASTTDANPIQAGTTVSALQITLQNDGNGVYPYGSATPLPFLTSATGAAIFPSTTGLPTTYRLQENRGASVASAGTVTLGNDGNYFHITGTTAIDFITNTNWQDGACFELYFESAITLDHNTGSPPGTAYALKLAGGVNASMAAGSKMRFRRDNQQALMVEMERGAA